MFGVSEGKLQEWGYVVMSRHQLDVQLYVVAPEWNEELDRPPRQLAYDPLAELTRSLGQSAAKTLATDRRDGDELAMRRALKTLAPGDLVRAIDTATELLVARPPERTGELRALAETRAVVAAACQNAAAAIGEGRTTPIDLERLNGRLADLDARREQLERSRRPASGGTRTMRRSSGEPSSPARNSWPAMPPTWQRSERDPPADLVADVGQRPTHLVAADAWRNSVAAIERFGPPTGSITPKSRGVERPVTSPKGRTSWSPARSTSPRHHLHSAKGSSGPTGWHSTCRCTAEVMGPLLAPTR